MGPKSKNSKFLGKCGKCNRSFMTLAALKSHATNFHKTTINMCSINGKKVNINADKSTCIKRKKLAQHQHDWQKLHDAAITNYKIFGCAACNYVSYKYKDAVKHIDSCHREGLVSFFFPIEEVSEFYSWKKEVEQSTKCNFLPRVKLENKKFYICSTHIDSPDQTKLILCPSTITIREYSKGIQAFFIRTHSGHTVDFYEPTPEAAKYLIYDKNKEIEKKLKCKLKKTRNISRENHKLINDNEALVLEFRNILTNLSEECVKLNPSDLTYFINIAMTMKDSVDNITEKNNTIKEEQPEIMIEDMNGSMNIETDTKDLETPILTTSPFILNTFSLSNSDLSDSEAIPKRTRQHTQTKTNVDTRPKTKLDKIDEQNMTKMDTEETTKEDTKEMSKIDTKETIKKDIVTDFIEKPIPKYSLAPTHKNFNETYEKFVAQHSGGKIIKKEDPVDPLLIELPVSNNKKNDVLRERSIKAKDIIGKKLKMQDTAKRHLNVPIKNMLPKATSSFYNKKKNNNQPTNINLMKRRSKNGKVKTKLGQFSPKKSENIITEKKIESEETESSLVDKLIKFNKYEVKERDNDCNILILKF